MRCESRVEMSSLASQIFNTQGFVSPYVMQYKKLLPMLWHNNTTWDEHLIGKTAVVDGEQVIDTVAKDAVARFSDVPWLKELRFKRYEPGHLERVSIFGDSS